MQFNKFIILRKFSIAMAICLIFTACASVSSSNKDSAEISSDAQSTPVIIGNSFKIDSTVYGATRNLTVRLPAAYSKAPDTKFPVMFVIDGGAEQDFPHLAGMLQSADINYSLEPFILVGIETVDRRYEITPPASDSRYDAMFEKRGGAEEFRQYIREDVMPWVQTNYRTKNDHGVIGESLGGMFIVDTFLKDPDLFQRYAAISPSLWWDDMHLGKIATAQLKNFSEQPKQLYLSMGNEGWNMQKGLDMLLAALTTNPKENLKWSYVDLSDQEEHGSIYHPTALDAFRTFYSTPYNTGISPKSFYMFSEGETPELSARAKKSLENDCTKEHATVTTFAEVNANSQEWNGVCVMMKSGFKATLSSDM